MATGAGGARQLLPIGGAQRFSMLKVCPCVTVRTGPPLLPSWYLLLVSSIQYASLMGAAGERMEFLTDGKL